MFQDKLSHSDWSHVINCNDVEMAYSNFVNIYEKLNNESCPVQSRKNVAKKNWMTPALLKSRRTKEKLFKKYQETPTNENKQNYCQYKNKFTCLKPGADPGIYFGGGQTKVPNRKLRAKPESRARSARVSRAKPESRARSARELRAKPEPRAKPEKKRGEGSGEGAR